MRGLVVDLRQYQDLHAVQMLRSIIRQWWGLELAFSDAEGWVSYTKLAKSISIASLH